MLYAQLSFARLTRGEHERVRGAAEVGVSRCREEQSGFSLIELLVVVAILAILAAVAIPLFLNQKNKAYGSQVVSRTHEYVVETETYRSALPSGSSLNLTALATALEAYRVGNPTRVNTAVMLNCAINAAGTAAVATPGSYIVNSYLASGSGSWGSVSGVDNVIYNSADSRWYVNNAALATVVGGSTGAGTSNTECGSSWYSGAVFLQANK